MNHEGTERSTPPGAPAEGTGPVSGTGSVSRTGPGASAGAGTGGDRQPRAVVVGGGLAGITAALQLAESGVHVTLLEGRPRLGGLAFSFRRGDLTVDNGQHVYLRCCTAYRWFLDRVDGAGLAPSRTASTSPSSTSRTPVAPGSAGSAATACPYRCTSRAASPPTRTSPSPSEPPSAGPRSP